MFEEISRGFLPENYYAERLVFKRKPPVLRISHYPNKIEVDARRSYAIVARKAGARLVDVYAWMSTHPYVVLNYVASAAAMAGTSRWTGNIVVEAYESTERSYAMVVFRAAAAADESTNHVMKSHGDSARHGPCPAPVTGLLCRAGTNLKSVWQWLCIHRGRLAYVIAAPLIDSVIVAQVHHSYYQPQNALTVPGAAVALRPRGGTASNRSRESVDSALPQYEPPPPSLHDSSIMNYSIREEPAAEEEVDSDRSTSGNSADVVSVSTALALPPPYWEIAQQTEYGRTHISSNDVVHSTASSAHLPCLAGGGLARTFTQSMPSLIRPQCGEEGVQEAVAAAVEDSRRRAVETAGTSSNEHALRIVAAQQSAAMHSSA
ncbi:hypothetical protein GGH92_010047, partial [Coemansia sp. RSA 2673]